MLQPRIPSSRFQHCWQGLSLQFRRSYAAVLEPSLTGANAPLDPALFAAPPPLPMTTKQALEAGAGLRRYKPRTPGLRHLVRPINDHLWKGRPVHALTYPKKGHGKGGRNHTGHITMRHMGGGHKRRIRTVDFGRTEPGVHDVERIEHDPNRSAHIALVRSRLTNKQSYILAAEGLRGGDVVESYRMGIPDQLMTDMGGKIDLGILATKIAFKGNCLPLKYIPVGTPIFNITPHKDDIGKMCRSAGTHGIILSKGEDAVQKEMIKAFGESGSSDLSTLSASQLARFEKIVKYCTVKISSGEIRLVDADSVATIGVASNINNQYKQLGKAGRARWLNIRPTVRGVAMNACDHPHGGGRGKSKGGVHPKTPWGKPTKSGYKTRPKNKVNPLIVQEKPRNQGRRRKRS